MTFATEMKEVADDLLNSDLGATLTFAGANVPADPVTGAGGGPGATFDLRGVITKVDMKLFDETLIEASDRMIVAVGDVELTTQHFWQSARGPVAIMATKPVNIDDLTLIVNRAVVRG